MATEMIDWPPLEKVLPKVELVAEDGEPMESIWHLFCTVLLLESIKSPLRGRDYFAGGNQFIYFNVEQARNRDFRGPDFYVVLDVPREPMRPYWCVWEEGGKYPNVIVELLSATTAKTDRTIKKDIYEKIFRTPNYFCFDPDARTLQGWQLRDETYEALEPNESGWLWCSQLQLWLGPWEGKFQDYQATWVRFYDRDNKLIPTPEEMQRTRAEQAESELAQLKARLAELEKPPT
jgi:Uma2 family endonuclease